MAKLIRALWLANTIADPPRQRTRFLRGELRPGAGRRRRLPDESPRQPRTDTPGSATSHMHLVELSPKDRQQRDRSDLPPLCRNDA